MEPVMRCERHHQRDLFEPQKPIPTLHPSLRTKLTSLLRVLLTETAGIKRVEHSGGEVGDDQDHA
jgi:hypothetical protein